MHLLPPDVCVNASILETVKGIGPDVCVRRGCEIRLSISVFQKAVKCTCP